MLKKMLVRKIYNKNFFFSLVLALVGNKDDMYQFEEVSNDEGIAFAKELKAIYKRTSAKVASGGGIDDLFKDIGKQFLHPDSEITSNMTKEELKNQGEKLRREKAKYEKTQLELKDLSDNGADTEKLIKEKIEEVANLQAELSKYEYLGKTLSGYAEQDEIVLLKKNEKYQSIIEKSDIGKAFSSEEWKKVDTLLKEEYPNFHHFMNVKKESLSDFEYYICLLIRLYIPIKSCAHILGVDPSYVTKLRKQLHTKLFKGEGNSKSFDRLLRSISESSKEMGGE